MTGPVPAGPAGMGIFAAPSRRRLTFAVDNMSSTRISSAFDEEI